MLFGGGRGVAFAGCFELAQRSADAKRAASSIVRTLDTSTRVHV